ncbi:MAG: hypothetical protein ABI600_06645 [Luteolibacter sp.]
MFSSRTVLAGNEKEGRSVELSPIHAAQAILLADDYLEKHEPNADAVARLRQHTRIKAGKGWAEIVVVDTNKFYACELAAELTWLFRGMDAEAALENVTAEFPLRMEDARELLEKRRSVDNLMHEEARDGAGLWDFRMIPVLAKGGAPAAMGVWQSKTFQLHWQFHQMATSELLGPSKSDLPVLPILEHPQVSDVASSPNVNLYLRAGLLFGLGFGGLIGFRRSRRMVFSDDDESSDETISYGIQRNLSGQPPPLRQQRRDGTPEDEW